MRAGRFGFKAGRVAVVAAFVLGILAVGTVAANADEIGPANDTAATTIGQVAQTTADVLARANGSEWS